MSDTSQTEPTPDEGTAPAETPEETGAGDAGATVPTGEPETGEPQTPTSTSPEAAE